MDRKTTQETTTASDGLSSDEAKQRLAEQGPNEIGREERHPLRKFLGYFWGPIPWMIEVAAALSLLVRHWVDFGIIIVLLGFNAVVGFWEEYQAGNAIDRLRERLALKARVKRDGHWQQIAARELVNGDLVRLRLGDVVPADIELGEGDYLSVDQSALTGESLPVDKHEGDTAYSGSVVKQGEMLGTVTATGANTYFGRAAQLVSSAKQVSHFQKAVLAIGDYLIYITLGLVALLLLVGLHRGQPMLELIQFSLILTVAAIPVALPAVLSVTMAVGANLLSKLKAIVSRLESIEEMAGMDVLCSDKTGTLTQNRLTLGEPTTAEGVEVQSVILAGALASKEEDQDAIDLAVLKGLKEQSLDAYNQQRFVPFDPVHKRTEALIEDNEGNRFGVTKGAPQVILDLCQPDQDLRRRMEDQVEAYAQRGNRTLGVARREGEDGAWRFLGLLPLSDPPREDAADTIAEAGKQGISVKMVTGDNLAIAKDIAERLDMGRNILPAEQLGAKDTEIEASGEKVEKADGYAQVFPEHKYGIVKALQARGHLVGMTGDGVNDAPALKQADVGIAVAGATDAARAAADLVLTAPGLSVIVRAVQEARRIFERMNAYSIYRITETIRIMLFMVSAMLIYQTYPITAVMIILLALLNDLPIMTIAYDNTWLSPQPVRWAMRRVLTVATVLGGIGVIETLALLIIAKTWFGIEGAELQSVIFLKLVVAGHLTLVVARSQRAFFRRPYPAPILIAAVLTTQAIAAMIVGFGWFVQAIPWSYVGWIWLYCLAWMLVEDGAKLLVYRHLAMGAPHHIRFLSRLRHSLMEHARG